MPLVGRNGKMFLCNKWDNSMSRHTIYKLSHTTRYHHADLQRRIKPKCKHEPVMGRFLFLIERREHNNATKVFAFRA